jgi:hypothetical protein
MILKDDAEPPSTPHALDIARPWLRMYWRVAAGRYAAARIAGLEDDFTRHRALPRRCMLYAALLGADTGYAAVSNIDEAGRRTEI